MDEPVELVVIGGGNMGEALVGGLLASGAHSPDDVAVVEIDADRRSALAGTFPDIAVHDTCPPCRSAVLAVKPQHTADAAATAADAGAGRVLSIAAGVTTGALEEAIAGRSSRGEGEVAVVRAMPNTPALVGRGASAISGGSAAATHDLEWAASILGAVGIVEELAEHDLDAFTATIGSGPAYVFLVAEALIDAAVAEGLDADTARRTVVQLMVGAAALLESGDDPAELRRKVTSPGGTTEAGLGALDRAEVRGAFAAAVRAAAARGRELG
ncbi:MAG: pyrroline-5-carboxylate reductase [Actinomycetota bacterium]